MFSLIVPKKGNKYLHKATVKNGGFPYFVTILFFLKILRKIFLLNNLIINYKTYILCQFTRWYAKINYI